MKKCFSDQNQQICYFEEGNSPVVTLYTILVRFWKKRSGYIKEFVKSFLRNISVFKKLLHFSLGENANSKIDVVFLILRRNIKFCKEFFFAFYLLDNLRLDESCCQFIHEMLLSIRQLINKWHFSLQILIECGENSQNSLIKKLVDLQHWVTKNIF